MIHCIACTYMHACTHRMSEDYRKSFQRQIALADLKSIFSRRKYRDTCHFRVNERLRKKGLFDGKWATKLHSSIKLILDGSCFSRICISGLGRKICVVCQKYWKIVR